MSAQQAVRRAARRLLPAPFLLGILLFATAGSLAYWQAWAYVVVLFVPMAVVLKRFAKTSPELLERRMELREPQRVQQLIVAISLVFFVLAYVLPGLDQRFGWSSVPAWLVVLADGGVLLSYLFIGRSLKENAYASRVVRVESGQAVTSTGPYALVRHPMYLGMVALYLWTPLALGSYWALLPCLVLSALLVARIFNEEQVLRAQLPGYREYMQQVRYRLVPHVW